MREGLGAHDHLAKFGDVRLNGALVGRVEKIGQDGEEAEITLALNPDAAKKIVEAVKEAA